MEDTFTQFQYYNPGDNLSALASEELLREIGVDIKRFLDMPKEQPKKAPMMPAFGGGMMLPALPSLAQLGGPPPTASKLESALPTRVLEMKYRQGTLSKA